MERTSANPPFLGIDSEIGNLMRQYDWTASSLGTPESWPQSLKSKLNTLMSSAFPMVLFWGEDLICFYNDAFRPSLGNEGKHPAIGKKGKEVWAETWDFVGPLIYQVLATGKAVWFEDQLVPFYRNGKIEDIYWTFSYSPVTNDLHQIHGVLVICTETTEKVNLLKRLEESNNLYAFAIDASELGTWDLNPRNNKFLANARLKSWLGLEPGEQIQLSSATNAITPNDQERVAHAIQKSLQPSSGGLYHIEYTIVNAKTGQERVVRAVGKAAFDEQGQATRFNGTLQDITAEVAAREATQKLSVLVENSVDLMAILKMDGKNSYINQAGKELLGVDETEDVTQIPISDFHTPEQLEFVESQIIPSVISTGKWAGTFAIKNRKTGEIIPLYNNCHRIDNERTGEPVGVGTVMRDIRSEINIRQKLEDEVRQRTLDLVKLNEQLERKNKDLASFAFISSHDLQEPLRKINTFVSRIQENCHSLTDENTGYFEKIKKSATRMQTLISDLLSFSRTNITQVNFEITDFNDILAQTLEEYQYKIEAANGTVKTLGLPVLNAIPFQIRQIFDNLIANAIKFARRDVPLEIIVSGERVSEARADQKILENGYYRIVIQDNGIGFQPQYQEKIFEVFQRLHAREVYEGTGIGLAICKKIMENHNGYVTARGIPEKGATFELYFPA
ncbi:Adaptive-response sensory-kinase SasA [Dyadobacter sp. CECT 9275]|uniref:histidine kinase n=1 Tax=Dyadobacter helix TaxID=2822344 RepID=A0A916N5Z5_9BACT|nr:PAS domain-containing sensor histidine kinase [Dyadobacter sp. CECT 9275]CAG5000735.1 Adaptive-response sensory-kinase SasA [Dyadobacter sp. CECT 9275]